MAILYDKKQDGGKTKKKTKTWSETPKTSEGTEYKRNYSKEKQPVISEDSRAKFRKFAKKDKAKDKATKLKQKSKNK